MKRASRRCQWMVQAKGWKDCGYKATHVSRSTGLHYCPLHRFFIAGWGYDIVELKGKVKR